MTEWRTWETVNISNIAVKKFSSSLAHKIRLIFAHVELYVDVKFAFMSCKSAFLEFVSRIINYVQVT